MRNNHEEFKQAQQEFRNKIYWQAFGYGEMAYGRVENTELKSAYKDQNFTELMDRFSNKLSDMEWGSFIKLAFNGWHKGWDYQYHWETYGSVNEKDFIFRDVYAIRMNSREKRQQLIDYLSDTIQDILQDSTCDATIEKIYENIFATRGLDNVNIHKKFKDAIHSLQELSNGND